MKTSAMMLTGGDHTPEGVATDYTLTLEEARKALALARKYGAPSYNWRAVVDLLEQAAQDDECCDISDDGAVFVYAWIGSALAITPSGKVYAPWTSNQTLLDVAADELWRYSMDDALGFLGVWFGTPDGSAGDDIFLCAERLDFTEQKSIEVAREKSATLNSIIASHN